MNWDYKKRETDSYMGSDSRIFYLDRLRGAEYGGYRLGGRRVERRGGL